MSFFFGGLVFSSVGFSVSPSVCLHVCVCDISVSICRAASVSVCSLCLSCLHSSVVSVTATMFTSYEPIVCFSSLHSL